MTYSDVIKKPSDQKGPAVLGFGCMRLPGRESQILKMTDAFLEAGFNYFDTAYLYGDSEENLKKALVQRYPRESYIIVDKIAPWVVKDHKSCEEIFNVILKRLGVDYLDFLLVHSIDNNNIESALKADLFGYVSLLKSKGKAKHIGLSFHGDHELLEKIFIKQPEMEFVQLQLNYMDILRGPAGKLHEIAIKYDKPIIAMEPMRGGNLAKLPPAAESLMKNYAPDASIASWANRYAASLHGVTCLLSGMSSLSQMKDNIKTFSPLRPINEKELEIIESVIVELGKVSAIPCTGCNYCLAECPEQIEISQNFSFYNGVKRGSADWNMVNQYNALSAGTRAEDCTSCGSCIPRCPQHIDIPEELKKVMKMFK